MGGDNRGITRPKVLIVTPHPVIGAGIETVLRVRFGPDGLKLMPEIRQVYGEEKLSAILEALAQTR